MNNVEEIQDGQFTYDFLRDQYRAVLKAEVQDNWLRGQIAEELYRLYEADKAKKGNSKLIDNFLSETGETRVAFNQRRWVYNAFEDEHTRTLPGLVWTHFRAAAGTENPNDWILKAHDNKWSTKRLIDEIEAAKAGKIIDAGVDCAQCSTKVEKNSAVTISVQKRKRILCSITCGIEWLKQEQIAGIEKLNVETQTITTNPDFVLKSVPQ